jgi:predicted lipoprotein with Yx(FWY)xxD motif
MNPHDIQSITRSRLAALGAAMALVVAACGNTGGGTTPAPTAAATQAATAAATEGASAGAEALEIELGDSDTLGQYLVGEDGKSLYLFTPDTTTASNCNGDCATAWPPLTVAAGETVKGAEGVSGTFGTITRQDGAMQVTYAGHPLYYFSGDAAAGDTNGQGLNDKWYLVKPDGSAITTMPATSGGRSY